MEDYKSGYKLVTKPTLRQNRYICIILYINKLPKPRLKNKKKRVSKKYLAPSIYSYPYWRLKSNIRFYKGVFCLFGHPLKFSDIRINNGPNNTDKVRQPHLPINRVPARILGDLHNKDREFRNIKWISGKNQSF